MKNKMSVFCWDFHLFLLFRTLASLIPIQREDFWALAVVLGHYVQEQA